ncbi:MAG: hypothetical protein JWP01_4105 [Myxococcales bacterium]|nr:hypothetical protein [Myxococcales bacterium]
MSGRRLALVVLAALTVPGTHALAQSPAPGEGDIDMNAETPPGDAPSNPAEPAPIVKDPKLAKKLHAAGQQAAQKGDYSTRKNKAEEAKGFYEAAANAFQKAIETGDDPNYYFDLAVTEEKLGKLDLATRHLRTLLAAKEGVRPDVQKKAQAKFDDLTMKVGLVTLQVDPEGTTVSVGGASLGTSPFAEPLVFMPGSYTLSFESDGYQPKDVEIKVEAGSEAERKIELEPIRIVVTPPEPYTGPSEAPTVALSPSKVPLIIGGVVTVAALGTSIVTGLMAKGQHDTFVAADSTRTEREDARANGENYALLSDVMLGTTIVAAGFTAYWYVAKYRRGQDKAAAETSTSPNAPEMSKLDLVPWVQHDASGLTVMGAF